MKTAEEFMTFNQANVEAFVKSSQIVATGLQDMSKQFAAVAQATMDETMSAFRAMTSVRSFKEAVDLQSSLARSTLEKAMQQTNQVAESSLRLAGDAIAPITGRVNVAVESFGKTV